MSEAPLIPEAELGLWTGQRPLEVRLGIAAAAPCLFTFSPQASRKYLWGAPECVKVCEDLHSVCHSLMHMCV